MHCVKELLKSFYVYTEKCHFVLQKCSTIQFFYIAIKFFLGDRLLTRQYLRDGLRYIKNLLKGIQSVKYCVTRGDNIFHHKHFGNKLKDSYILPVTSDIYSTSLELYIYYHH